MDTFDNQQLSRREDQILRLAARGLTDKEIATKTDISLCTVRTYWERLRQKMHAVNRAAAIAIYLNNGFAAERAAVPEPDELMIEAVDAALGGIAVLDSEGNIRGANAKAEELFGAEPGGLTGIPISSLILRHFEAFHMAFQRISAGVEATCTVPAFAKGSKGRSLLVHITLRGLDREDGRHTVLFIQDAVEELDARRRGAATRMINWTRDSAAAHLS